MENNQYDILNDAMKQSESAPQNQNYNNGYGHSTEQSVDPSAERFLDIVNTTLKIIGIVIVCIGVIISLAMVDEMGEESLLGVLGCLFMLIGVLISWAIIKVFINISRNLFNISNRLKAIENKLNK
jgi:hypothetical protein